jgi:hypothetical protein
MRERDRERVCECVDMCERSEDVCVCVCVCVCIDKLYTYYISSLRSLSASQPPPSHNLAYFSSLLDLCLPNPACSSSFHVNVSVPHPLERGYLLLQFLPLFHRRPKSLLRLRSALQYAVCARIRDRVLWMLSKKREKILRKSLAPPVPRNLRVNTERLATC